jgi:hypothetical protein
MRNALRRVPGTTRAAPSTTIGRLIPDPRAFQPAEASPAHQEDKAPGSFPSHEGLEPAEGPLSLWQTEAVLGTRKHVSQVRPRGGNARGGEVAARRSEQPFARSLGT